MAKEIRPWFRYFPLKFRNSPRVIGMSIGAKGAYHGIIDSLWINGGRIPNVPSAMWKYADCTPAEWEQVKDEVMPMLTPSEDGKWLTNETLSEEWEHANERYDDIRAKRKAAAKARWDKQHNASALQNDANGVQADTDKRRREEKRENLNPPSSQEPTKLSDDEVGDQQAAKAIQTVNSFRGDFIFRDLTSCVKDIRTQENCDHAAALERFNARWQAAKADNPKLSVKFWIQDGKHVAVVQPVVDKALSGVEKVELQEHGVFDYDQKPAAEMRSKLMDLKRRRQG